MNVGSSTTGLVPILAREEAALARVLYRLTVMVLLIAAGEQRFLSRAADDLDVTSEELAAVETVRALTVSGLADTVGASDQNLTLARIVGLAGGGEAAALEEHGQRLALLLEEIDALARSATGVAASRLGETRAALSRWTDGVPPTTYPHGSATAPVPPIRFDGLA